MALKMMASFAVYFNRHTSRTLWYFIALMALALQTVSGLSCVQCASVEHSSCRRGDIPATPCVGHHAGAKYCFKSLAKQVPKGQEDIVTRGCTDRIQSNCTDQTKNDYLYKTCHYTCAEDGCNSSPQTTMADLVVRAVVSILVATLFARQRG